MVVRNVNNVFGFVQAYAHHGRGLIIYDGLDRDQAGTFGYDMILSRELAVGFDPDNLPCAARLGDFVVTTETALAERPMVPGRSYTYPLTLLSNQGYTGTVNLSLSSSPAVDGLQQRLEPTSDLNDVGGGTVILITDGEESCKGDALKAAAELKASGLDVTLNIVGFALNNPQVQKQLGGFAQATGGHFYSAENGPALAQALFLAAIDKFPFTVYDASGKQVLVGEAGDPAEELPPGDYKLVMKAGNQEVVAPRVRVALGQMTTVRIVVKNGVLVLEQ